MNTSEPRYPDVEVKLTGTDSNTMFLLGRVTRALRRAGHGDVADECARDIMSADSPDEALQKMMQWVSVW